MFTTRAGLPNPPVRVRVEGKERSDSAIIAWGETFSLFNILGGLFQRFYWRIFNQKLKRYDRLVNVSPLMCLKFNILTNIISEPPVLEGEQQILRYNLKLNTVTGTESTANRTNGDVLEFHTTDDTKILINSLLPGTLYR